MSRYNDNECAYCAEDIGKDNAIIGTDWKVYCSLLCAREGEALSRMELFQLMHLVTDRRTYDADRRRSELPPPNLASIP
jgi:hypothetical protein